MAQTVPSPCITLHFLSINTIAGNFETAAFGSPFLFEQNNQKKKNRGQSDPFFISPWSFPVYLLITTAGKALGAFVFIAETRELDRSIQQEMEEALLHAADNDSSREVRDLCLRSLGFSSRPEVPKLIEEAFASVGESRIAAALCAMARSANEAWGENVLAHLHDSSPIIRLEAIRAAGEISLSEGVPELIELLDDIDKPVRRASIWSLSQIGGMKASEVLNSLAETELDEDEQETLQDAIDNLVFADGAHDVFSFDQDDAQDPLA